MADPASPNPTPVEFAARILAEIKRLGLPGDWSFNEPEFTMSCERHSAFLGNVYADYCAATDPAHRARLYSNFVSVMGNPRTEEVTRETALEECVAAVRERALFAFTQLKAQILSVSPGTHSQAYEPISEWLARTIVLDSPGSMRGVNESELRAWGMDFEELFAAGLTRLRASTPLRFKAENGYYVGGWQDDYDSSRLLLPGLFAELPFTGDPVLVVPNRLVLMAADSRNEPAVAAMLARAEEIVATMPRPMNASPLTYREGRLRDFTVPRESPLFLPVSRARYLTARQYYTEQKGLLDRLYEKTGEVFVSNFTVAQSRQDGSYFSLTCWTNTVPSLLTRADCIVFVDLETEPHMRGDVPWEKAVSVLKDRMVETGMFPARWKVSDFPTAAQFQEMGVKCYPIKK